MSEPLAARFARERNRPRVTAGSVEIDRIVRLPTILMPTEEEAEVFAASEIEAHEFARGFRFFPVQTAAVLSYDLFGGLFAPIGVGWGKTLITLMIAARAYRDGIPRSLLMVPPQVYAQLTRRDIPWARARVDLNVPFMPMGGKTQSERRAIARSGKKGCYILPYSCLSTKDSTELLNWIAPGLLILDEAHALKNRKAARTRRVMDYIERHQPRLVAASGTITSKSIKDYHHLIVYALREFSPLPLSGVLADQWSLVLDAQADPSDAHLGPVTPLLRWAADQFPEEELPPHIAGFRKAFKLRLVSAPGVVATGDAEIGVSLTLSNRPVEKYEERPGWPALKEKLEDVNDRWISPSGDEIDYAFHQWKHLFELNSGFFYRLQWPSSEQMRERRPMSQEEAETFLAMAQEHHFAQQVYHRKLRTWLGLHFIAGMDTPMLVGSHMSTHGATRVGSDLYDSWRAMKDLEFQGMPERDSIPVRVCDFKIRAAREWVASLEKGVGAIIWHHHQEIGTWLAEDLQEAGFDVLHCSAGEQHNISITDPVNQNRIVVASISAHGTGKNLQAFQRQLFAQFPRQADVAEQCLGRTHRNGQQADELIAHTLNTTDFDHQNFAACLIDALYQHQTVGARQKVIYAVYDPLPKMYPSDFLRERGFQNRVLSVDEQRVMDEKFRPAPES